MVSLQPCWRMAPLIYLCVMLAFSIQSLNSMPPCIKVCGRPSIKCLTFLLFSTNLLTMKLSVINVIADLRPPTNELSLAFIEFWTALGSINNSTKLVGAN